MALRFFGRGAGLSDEHTSAYFFTENNDLVIIDCAFPALSKIKKLDLQDVKDIYVLVTHTHGDHIGELGLLVQYAFFVHKKKVTIVAPSDEVAETIYSRILIAEGNEASWFNIVTANTLKEKEWFKNCILTEHSPQLAGQCFGYNLLIDGTNIIYTGDTSTLEPFLGFLQKDSILYVDTSVYYGQIHLKLSDALNDFINLNKNNIKVYLMHLDDAEEAEKIVKGYSDINVVPLD